MQPHLQIKFYLFMLANMSKIVGLIQVVSSVGLLISLSTNDILDVVIQRIQIKRARRRLCFQEV